MKNSLKQMPKIRKMCYRKNFKKKRIRADKVFSFSFNFSIRKIDQDYRPLLYDEILDEIVTIFS